MNIVTRFIEICLFKAGPADVPVSHWLMKVTLVSYFIIGVVLSRIDNSWEISLFSSLTDMLMMVVVLWLLLQFRGLLARYQQTLTAMAGAGSCLGIVGIPIVMLFNQVSDNERFASVAMLLMIALMFWSLMITAHIFRLALEVKTGTSVALTVAYTVLSLIAVGLTVSGVA